MRDIKTEIFNCGRKLFGSKGFKATNVIEITSMAGVGVGTFYKCYPSKEKLFIDIYTEENEKLKKSIMESIDLDIDPALLVTKLVTQNISGINSNLILKEWYEKDLFSKLEHYFYKQGGLENIDKLMNSGKAELIEKWKSDGKIRSDIGEDMIVSIINSIMYIDIHKSEIGIQHFPQIIYYITDFIMKGLAGYQK